MKDRYRGIKRRPLKEKKYKTRINIDPRAKNPICLFVYEYYPSNIRKSSRRGRTIIRVQNYPSIPYYIFPCFHCIGDSTPENSRDDTNKYRLLWYNENVVECSRCGIKFFTREGKENLFIIRERQLARKLYQDMEGHLPKLTSSFEEEKRSMKVQKFE